jgi:hypothetical protein
LNPPPRGSAALEHLSAYWFTPTKPIESRNGEDDSACG